MSPNTDKYPDDSGRRRFVKGVVATSTLAAVGTGAAASVGAATSASGAGGGVTSYLGIENTDGPAPRSMPQVPVEIDDEGFLKGVWPESVNDDGVGEMQLGGQTYRTSWFQYCGAQTAAGVDPEADRDPYFRSKERTPYTWQADRTDAGQRLHVDMFDDYRDWGSGIGESGLGKPAVAAWRSADGSRSSALPVHVLRSERIEGLADRDTALGTWLAASTADGVIAWLNKCTHFCCPPTFKANPNSAKFGAADEVYCNCHQSVYDPFSIVKEQFVALPRDGD